MTTATKGKVKAAGTRQLIDDLLKGLDADLSQKQASEMGGTTHPEKSVDDGTQAASQGAHGDENDTRIKADEDLGVASATPNTSGEQASAQLDMGIKAVPVGEDPSVEGDIKATKDDPGSSMPARTDNSDLGGKFASERLVAEFTKSAEALGASLVTALTGGQQSKAAAYGDPFAGQSKEASAGTSLAETLLGPDLTGEEKQAADALAIQEVAQAVKYGSDLADSYLEYLIGAKQAEDEAAMAEQAAMAGGGGMPPGAEGGMPPEAPPAGGEGGGGGEITPELLQALLAASGEEGGGDQIPPELLQALLAAGGEGGGEGGMPPGAEGGMPPGAEGGMPPGAEGGGEEEVPPEVMAQMLAAGKTAMAKYRSKQASAPSTTKAAKFAAMFRELMARQK